LFFQVHAPLLNQAKKACLSRRVQDEFVKWLTVLTTTTNLAKAMIHMLASFTENVAKVGADQYLKQVNKGWPAQIETFGLQKGTQTRDEGIIDLSEFLGQRSCILEDIDE
jgi:hypothetical protein